MLDTHIITELPVSQQVNVKRNVIKMHHLACLYRKKKQGGAGGCCVQPGGKQFVRAYNILSPCVFPL